MTLDEHGHFRNFSLCNSKLVTRRQFDHCFVIKHLCDRKHLKEVEKKKHAKAILAKEKRISETKGLVWIQSECRKQANLFAYFKRIVVTDS